MIKTCQRCGQEFEGRKGTKFCPDCRPIAKRERISAYKKLQRQNRPDKMIKFCSACGEKFKATSNNAKYCPICRPIVRHQATLESQQRWREAHRDEKLERDREYRRQQKQRAAVVNLRNKFLAWRQRNQETLQ